MNLWGKQISFFRTNRNINHPPGSLVYSGEHKNEKINIEAYSYDPDGYKKETITDYSDIRKSGKIQWINITGIHDIKLIEYFGRYFDIHRMDLEDIVHVSQRSKIVKNNEYVFSVVKMMYMSKEKIIHEHLSIIKKGNMVITFQETKADVFGPLRERIETGSGQIRKMGSEYLFYAILDLVTDQYFEIMNEIIVKFDKVEEDAINNLTADMEEIYLLRKELLFLKNFVTPIKEALQNYTGEESAEISENVKTYYRDLIDHVNQINDFVTSYREMVNGIYEIQAANAGNRMNKIMMTLTVFSVIFIPLSFLAGVFGMNFKYFPGLENYYGIYYFAAACIIIFAGMITYFKIRKWY